MKTNIPELDDIKAAIEQSGYVLELQLCPIFEKAGFAAFSGKQFQDQDTGKSREIDIYAFRDKVLFSREHPKETRTILSDVLTTVLLVECKNNHLPVVFFSRKTLYPGMGDLLICGQPVELKGVEDIPKDSWVPIDQYLELDKTHRNFKFRSLAYRFSQMRPRNGGNGWVLTHEDLYGSINKLVKASQVFVNETNEVAHDKYVVNEILLGLIYPVLIFSGPIYECKVFQGGYRLRKTKHLALTWNIESQSCKRDCQIDVVAADYVPSFLRKLKHSDFLLERTVSNHLEFLKENVLRAKIRRKIHGRL